MGGFGSGRYGGRPTVESSLTLDLYKLIRDSLLRPSSGTLTWTYVNSGERVASVSYQVNMGDRRGWMRLTYTKTRWDGTKHDVDDWIELVTTLQPFGGR